MIEFDVLIVGWVGGYQLHIREKGSTQDIGVTQVRRATGWESVVMDYLYKLDPDRYPIGVYVQLNWETDHR